MMSPCEQIRLQLTEYAAGDLSPPAAAVVARHVDACPACRRELELERSLRATLGSLPVAACPAGIGGFTPAAAGPSRRRTRWPWGVGIAAAAGLAAVLVGGFLDRGPAPEFTAAEIAAARQDVAYTLGLAARVLERSQREAVVDVFGDTLPRAVTGSLKLKSPHQGDEG
jgi:anti-sigma factor RsiW